MKIWTQLKCDNCGEYTNAWIARSHELFDLLCSKCQKEEIEK